MCADYLASKHGGQRGNLITRIHARRIQKFFRHYRNGRNSIVESECQVKVLPLPEPIHLPKTTNDLLIQAKLCLDNKIIDDCESRHRRRHRHHRHRKNPTTELPIYLTNKSKEEENISTEQRRPTLAKSNICLTTMDQQENEP